MTELPPDHPDNIPETSEIDIVCDALRAALSKYLEARDNLDTALRALAPYAMKEAVDPEDAPLRELMQFSEKIRNQPFRLFTPRQQR